MTMRMQAVTRLICWVGVLVLLVGPARAQSEEPAAVVHLKPGMKATEEELRHFVSQKIAAFKVPVKVLFLPETLPRNANGKIMKRELRAHALG